MRNNIDDEIKNLLNKEETIPMSIRNKKEEAFNIIRDMKIKDTKNKKSLFNKKNIAVVTVLIVGGITLTSPILANVKDLIFNGRYKGVQTAIDNGYEQNIEGVYSESNGIRLEVIKAIVDPTMINLKFKVSSEDIKNMKKFKYAENGPSINTFNITDDKGRVIQFYDEKEGIGTKPIVDENGKEVWLVSGGDTSVDTTDISNGNVYFDIMLNSAEGNLGGIKSLNLQTNKIANLKGDWKLDVELDEAMINNDVVNYVTTGSNDNVEVLEATGIATGIKVKFMVNAPIDESIISKVKLVDKDGVVYRTDRPGWMEVENGKDIVEITFEASKFDNLGKFDFVIEDLNGKDEVIKLTKEVN
ncbi:hypothetical protein [uncultured Clostridium sp.]|uniref:hypothetical protein n=1 Tax=uncultured Clostridium sp. TaxID=59620 RepID=UPI002584D596|nr:hypothetical protein [uncultured Clostridium sp.]